MVFSLSLTVQVWAPWNWQEIKRCSLLEVYCVYFYCACRGFIKVEHMGKHAKCAASSSSSSFSSSSSSSLTLLSLSSSSSSSSSSSDPSIHTRWHTGLQWVSSTPDWQLLPDSPDLPTLPKEEHVTCMEHQLFFCELGCSVKRHHSDISLMLWSCYTAEKYAAKNHESFESNILCSEHSDFTVCTTSENSSITNQNTFLNRLASLSKYWVLSVHLNKPFRRNF